eukprot:2129584-Rhodomonas_salina.3
MHRGESVILLTLFVDDGLCATNDTEMYEQFVKDLGEQFELGEAGLLNWYLGVSIKQDLQAGTTTLSQKQYVIDLLERTGMSGATLTVTPLEPNIRLSKEDCPVYGQHNKAFVREYQQVVGSLQYLCNWSRPDLTQSVNECARFMANPGPTHMDSAKRILRYLAGTQELTLTYRRQSDSMANQIWGYADADHARDIDTRRSTTGYVMFMAGAAVSWQSKRQNLVALSSSEAEFYAASYAGCDVIYLWRLVEELGYKQRGPTPVFEDNWACIYLSHNATMFHKTKHVDVLVYNLREMCDAGHMVLTKVATGEQVADAFTKSLPRPAFQRHLDIMLGAQPDPVSAREPDPE